MQRTPDFLMVLPRIHEKQTPASSLGIISASSASLAMHTASKSEDTAELLEASSHDRVMVQLRIQLEGLRLDVAAICG